MGALHISKVAVGCASFEALASRQRGRVAGGIVPVVTRFRPKRADELVGGSIYWIVKHRLVARQSILGFGEGADGRTVIRLCPELVAVGGWPRRAHQGWRYLAPEDAPHDLCAGGDGVETLPPRLAGALAAIALI